MSVPSPSDNVTDTSESAAGPVEPAADPRRRPVRKQPPPVDPRPFVDQYRGTHSDNSTRKRRSVALRGRRYSLTWPTLIGAVAVVLALAVGGVYTMVGNRRPTGLSAFRNTTPAPAQVWVGRTASPSEPPVATACPGGASPTPQVWRAGSQHPAALFIGLMTRPDLSFHLQADVTTAMLGRSGALEYAMDVNARDYAFGLTSRSARLDVSVRAVVKDDRYYLRVDESRWVRGKGAPPPGDALGNATAESYDCLEYVGQEWANGRLLHHLRLPVSRWPGPIDRAFVIVKAPPSFRWDIWVDASGRPRSARTTIDVTMRADGRDVYATLNFHCRLSRFGKKITIEVPAPFRG